MADEGPNILSKHQQKIIKSTIDPGQSSSSQNVKPSLNRSSSTQNDDPSVKKKKPKKKNNKKFGSAEEVNTGPNAGSKANEDCSEPVENICYFPSGSELGQDMSTMSIEASLKQTEHSTRNKTKIKKTKTKLSPSQESNKDTDVIPDRFDQPNEKTSKNSSQPLEDPNSFENTELHFVKSGHHFDMADAAQKKVLTHQQKPIELPCELEKVLSNQNEPSIKMKSRKRSKTSKELITADKPNIGKDVVCNEQNQQQIPPCLNSTIEKPENDAHVIRTSVITENNEQYCVHYLDMVDKDSRKLFKQHQLPITSTLGQGPSSSNQTELSNQTKSQKFKSKNLYTTQESNTDPNVSQVTTTRNPMIENPNTEYFQPIRGQNNELYHVPSEAEHYLDIKNKEPKHHQQEPNKSALSKDPSQPSSDQNDPSTKKKTKPKIIKIKKLRESNTNSNYFQPVEDIKNAESYDMDRMSSMDSTGSQWSVLQKQSQSKKERKRKNKKNDVKDKTPPILMEFTRNQPELPNKVNDLAHLKESISCSQEKIELIKEINYMDEESSLSSEESECSLQSEEQCASSEIRSVSSVHETAKGSIGVFWDIENCAVPKGLSPREIVKKIRETFYGQRKEDVFTVACDVTNLTLKIRTELNNAQVDLVHVDSVHKEAADAKLKDYLRKFVEVKRPKGSCVVMISGDADFARELHNLRYRHQIFVVLIPGRRVRPELCDMANQVIPFHEFTQNVMSLEAEVVLPVFLFIQNIPYDIFMRVSVIVKNLARNLNGELKKNANGCCVIRFNEKADAEKALAYFSGEKKAVFESKEVMMTLTNAMPKLPGKIKTVIEKTISEVEPMAAFETLSGHSTTEETNVNTGGEEIGECVSIDEENSTTSTLAILLLESDHNAGAEFWKGFLKNIIKNDSSHEVIVQNNQIHVCFSTLKAAELVKMQLEKEQQAELKVIGISKELDSRIDLGHKNVMNLITECKTMFLKKSQKMILWHSDKKSEFETQVDGLTQVLRSLPSCTKPSEYAKLQEILEAAKARLSEWESQEAEFKFIVSQKSNDLDQCYNISIEECNENLVNLKQQFSWECDLFSKGLPIYALKTKVIDLVLRNAVSILLAEVGSGKSTQIAQYLFQAGLAKEGIIVCTQPRKMAATNLAINVSSQMSCAVGSLVGSKVGMQHKCSKDTKILYMTDHCLLNEYLKDPTLSKYTCVIIDEVHEKSVFTDLLLVVLGKILKQRLEFKILLNSSIMDPSPFQNYFSLNTDAILKIPGIVFPIEIIWGKNPSRLGDNYVEKAVLKAFDVHNLEDPGHILVFLTTPAETLEACEAFGNLIRKQEFSNKAVGIPLHDNLDDAELNSVFSTADEGTRRVIFTTSCAETSLTIPGISYVIDTGMTMVLQYDAKTQTNSLETKFETQSSAEQRKEKAGRTQGGKCFRLFSKENYNQMAENTKPEITRASLDMALLKIMQLGVENPCNFQFINSPPPIAFLTAMKNLSTLGAIANDRLTELGQKMAKLSLEPSLAKLVIRGFEESVGFEAVVIVSLASVVGNISFKLEDSQSISDRKNTQIFQEGGDFLSFLSYYKTWLYTPNAEKPRWCLYNNINGKTMKIISNSVREIQQTCEQELGIPISNKHSSQALANDILQYLILEVFKQNLCIFSGHPQLGYITEKNFEHIDMHPSSSLSYLGYKSPKFVVYQTKIVTSKNYIIHITPVSEKCLEKAIQNGLYNEKLIDNLKGFSINPVHFGPFGNTIFNQLCGIEEDITDQIKDTYLQVELELQTSKIVVICKEKYKECVSKIMAQKVKDTMVELKKEDLEISIDGTSEGNRYLLSAGAVLTEVIMPGEFVGFSLPSGENRPYLFEILQKSKHPFSSQDLSRKNKNVILVTFKNVEAAMEVATLFNCLKIPILPENPMKSSQEKQDLPPLHLEVSWIRRPCRGTATLKFVSPADFALYSPTLVNSKELFVCSKPFVITLCKNKPDELILKNLDCLATADTVRKALNKVFKSNVQVEYDLKLVQMKEFKTSIEEKIALEVQLANVFSQYTRKGDIIVKLAKSKPSSNFWIARIYFHNARDGQISFNALNNCIKFPGTEFPVQMALKMNSTIVCHKDVYSMAKEYFEKALLRLKKAAQKGDVLGIKANLSTNVEDFVEININCNNVRDMELALKSFQDILRGDKIHCLGKSLRKNLFLEDGKTELMKLQLEFGGAIHLDPVKKIISIMGSSTAIASIKAGINDYLGSIDGQPSKIISLAYPNKPRGFVKLLVKVYSCTLEKLQIELGLASIHLNIPKHYIIILGSNEAIQKTEEVLCKLSSHISEEVSIDGGEVCPVCFCTFSKNGDHTYRLECCGHIYCLECIQALLKCAQIPLSCAVEDCHEPFVMADLNCLVDEDNRSLIAAAALKHAVEVNKEKFNYCPTHECPAVYKVPPKGTSNTRFFCNMCTNHICTRCNEIYHEGISCEMQQYTKEGQEFPTERWLMENPTKRTLCPDCSIGIERNGESNHMSCWKCSAHMCWLCRTVFPTALEVHLHQPFCPRN